LSNESLCVRLRSERERRHIALSSISANTKISATLFESLERGDVSRWPSGIYRRSFIRAYAVAIGLDPDTVAREFLEQFPDPLESPPAVEAPPVTAGAAGVAGPAPAPPAVPGAVVRVRVADAGRPFAPGRLLAGLRRRAAAAACDGGVVTAIALIAFIACDRFWLPLGVTMFAYYLGGILLLGNTPGVCLLAAGADEAPDYNQSSDEHRPEHAPGPAHPPWHFRMPAR
jgi:helix-turn-helix protein